MRRAINPYPSPFGWKRSSDKRSRCENRSAVCTSVKSPSAPKVSSIRAFQRATYGESAFPIGLYRPTKKMRAVGLTARTRDTICSMRASTSLIAFSGSGGGAVRQFAPPHRSLPPIEITITFDCRSSSWTFAASSWRRRSAVRAPFTARLYVRRARIPRRLSS